MTGRGNRVPPQALWAERPNSTELGPSDKPEFDVGRQGEPSDLSRGECGPGEQDRFSDELLKLADRCAATAVKDARTADKISGTARMAYLMADQRTLSEGADTDGWSCPAFVDGFRPFI